MSGRFHIRDAGPRDAAMLTALHAETFGDESWSDDQIHGSLALATTKTWAAYDGDTLLGFILCQSVPGEIEILTLCVSPARRRQRIGMGLLQAMMEAARANGGAKIFLEVAEDNIAARRLYESLGFTVTGTRAGYYKRGAVTVDGVMYGFEIND